MKVFRKYVWGSLGGGVKKKLAILPLHVHCINLHIVNETNFCINDCYYFGFFNFISFNYLLNSLSRWQRINVKNLIKQLS